MMQDILFKISATDWSVIARNYAAVITLGVGAYVALKGLNTWKEQLDLNDNRGLSKSIASRIYHIRTIYNDVRSGAYSDRAYLNKMDSTPKKNYNDPNSNQEYEKLREKFIAADDVKAELYPLLLEAELLWGSDIVNRIEEYFKELAEIQHSLFIRQIKLRRPFRDERSWEAQWNEITAIEEKVFLYSESEECRALSKLLQSKFDKVAQYLRSKIGTVKS